MTRILYTLSGTDKTRHFSPHAWKTALSLAHKGLDYQLEPVGFTQIPVIENAATKTVPLLRDGDRLIPDSFAIALHLEETYPDRPSLFGGEGGKATARFIESWTQTVLQAALIRIILMDIHDCLEPVDQAYYRASREARFGTTLEAVLDIGAAELQAFPARLEPLRAMLKKQNFIGGDSPLFADYIVFGALQWARITSPKAILVAGDSVTDWFERCLDLHDGLGRTVTAA